MEQAESPPAAAAGRTADHARAARLQQALQLHQRGSLELAERAYRELLAEAPDDADALNLLGVLAGQKGRLQEALELIERSLRVNPHHALGYANRSRVLLKLGKAVEALASAEEALRLAPRLVEALLNAAAAAQALGQRAQALRSCERAIELQPANSAAFLQRGYLLLDLRRPQEALESFKHVQLLRPRSGEVLRARARALVELNGLEQALGSYEQALRIDPRDGDAWEGRGVVLRALGLAAEALASYDRALTLGGRGADTHANRAAALHDVGRPAEAAESWERTRALSPDHPYALGNLLHARLQAGDWRSYDTLRAAVEAGVSAGKPVSTPFAFLASADSPRLQLQCARAYFADRHPQTTPPEAARAPRSAARRERLRLGYLSADFRNHATSRLTVGLFERHDRSAFTVAALSCGPDDGSPLRERVRRACDQFVDISGQSDGEAAERIRRLEIDILVDLNGFAAGGRTAILTQRPAPIQVSYLGYPGTLGAHCIDYLVADRYVIPDERRDCYAEKIAYLPDCYQSNDRERPRTAPAPPRVDEGLPEQGLVFCCFNAPYKITPGVFALWMRLLERVAGSVLWLYDGNSDVAQNLRREAARLGVAPERLVFAPHRDAEAHLARYALADLFLDTLPVNAHTTASDALWAGVPVLTCSGEGFAARVAGSLLRAVGLPELITYSAEQYEERAVELASAPAELERIRNALGCNRLTQPLFDTEAHCRNLERAYRLMWERWLRGEPPETFAIERPAGSAE
jgi:protein O-GlcNAc transferase